MRARWLLPLTALAACVGRDETTLALNYDHGTLRAYRSAIPTEARLVAAVPTAAWDNSMAAAEPAAILAAQGVVFARGVNSSSRDIARTLGAIAREVPSEFDAARQQFIWGPWESPVGPGELTLEIRKNPSALDFAYSFALARQMPGEPETRTAVLWGAATPDPEQRDQGTGLTAWDLDANAAFEAAHGGATAAAVGQGRVVLGYGYQDRAADSVYFNLATFRDFVAPSNGVTTAASPVSVEHFFGRVAEPSGTVLDFLRSEIDGNLCGQSPSSCFGAIPESSHSERLVFREFFENSGLGRAEVLLSGGDLASQVEMTECWNASLARTSYQVLTPEQTVQRMPSANCPGRAAQSAEELGLPTPNDVMPWLLDALDCGVETGALDCN